MALEEVCRCSCYGKNHGVLKRKGGKQPQRMCKIDGTFYKLEGIGDDRTIIRDANAINRTVGWMRIAPGVMRTLGDATEAPMPYHYQWRETDKHAPARVKRATFDQIEKWPELKSYQGVSTHRRPYLLWVREEMPEEVWCENDCPRCEDQRMRNFLYNDE